MPRWGRPPGARLGRPSRRRAQWEKDEFGDFLDTGEDDGYMLRGDRSLYLPQLASGMETDGRGGWRKRNLGYDGYTDETGPMDGVDYDLSDDTDSTVAYAVQLAIRDEEERLVDNALERIRRAHGLGQKNVRLSKREVDALERRRTQKGSFDNPRRKKGVTKTPFADDRRTRQADHATTNGAVGKTRSQRSGSEASPDRASPYLADNAWIQSGQRPRTPTNQTPRTKHSSPSLRPPIPQHYVPERYYSAPDGSPQSSPRMQPYMRSLPDSQWTPPYPTSLSPMTPYPVDQPPYPTHGAGSPSQKAMMPYKSGYQLPLDEHRYSNVSSPNSPRRAPLGSAMHESNTEDNNNNKDDSNGSSGDEVQIMGVVERKIPIGSPTRVSVGRGGLQRVNRR